MDRRPEHERQRQQQNQGQGQDAAAEREELEELEQQQQQQSESQRSAAARRRESKRRSHEAEWQRANPWPEPTPFAHLLAEYAYSQRTRQHPRPLSNREIGDRIGYSRATVQNWITQGIEPPLPTMLYVIHKLGIPINRLLEVYGAQLQADTAPTTPANAALRSLHDEQSRDAERITRMLQDTEANMRAAGLDDEEIERVLLRMRRKLDSDQPFAHHIAAEHETPAATPADNRSSRPDQKPQQQLPTPNGAEK